MNEFMKNVYMYVQKNKGMTLLEVLTAFTIFLTCASVIIYLMPLFEKSTDRTRQDIHMFFQQLEDDMDRAYEIQVYEDGWDITDLNDQFQYRKSGSQVVRSKNGKGYEIVLQNVTGVQADAQSYGMDIHIIDHSGAPWHSALGFRPHAQRREISE